MEALEQSAQNRAGDSARRGANGPGAFGQTRLRVTAAERTDYGADRGGTIFRSRPT